MSTHEPRVWAPAARSVEVVLGERRVALSPERGGWWSARELRLAPGEEYSFSLDGGRPLPDPRSRSQPRGVHGPSAVVDPRAFRWTDQGWQPPPWERAVVYEVHPGTFSPEGTFDGIAARLDHLVELGVTHLELMPSCEFAGQRGWGYDGVLLFAPHHAYGGPEGLARLVDACHARGLAVLLDVVWNHLGPEGNYLPRFAPYFAGGTPTPWGQGPNLDGPESDEVRRLFLDDARMWLADYHLDGLRVDAIDSFSDRRALHFLEELTAEVAALERELGRALVVVAENATNDPRVVAPRERHGLGFHAAWCDDVHGALHSALTGEVHGPWGDHGASLEKVARALERVFVHEGGWSAWRRRSHGRPLGPGVSAHRFVSYLQNHDQVGNRPQGERIGQLVSSGRAKAGAALVLLGPGVPMLFMGEEWSASTPFCFFTDLEPGLGDGVRRGRKKGFEFIGFTGQDGLDPQDPATFTAARLRWEERELTRHREMLAWYRALIALRRSSPDVLSGELARTKVRFDEAARWLVLDRGATAVAVNLGAHAQVVPLPRRGAVLLASEEGVALDGDGVRLPGDSVAVIG